MTAYIEYPAEFLHGTFVGKPLRSDDAELRILETGRDATWRAEIETLLGRTYGSLQGWFFAGADAR